MPRAQDEPARRERRSPHTVLRNAAEATPRMAHQTEIVRRGVSEHVGGDVTQRGTDQ